jgi:hypothetical protein
MSEQGQKIIALDAERMQAMVEKDLAKLSDMLCNNMFYNHFNLRVDTKQGFLDSIKMDTVIYKSIAPSEVNAIDLGDVVVLTGVADFDIEAKRADQVIQVQVKLRFTDIYQNQGGTWRMVAWHSTRFPD